MHAWTAEILGGRGGGVLKIYSSKPRGVGRQVGLPLLQGHHGGTLDMASLANSNGRGPGSGGKTFVFKNLFVRVHTDDEILSKPLGLEDGSGVACTRGGGDGVSVDVPR